MAEQGYFAIDGHEIIPLEQAGLDENNQIIRVIPPEPTAEKVRQQQLAALDAEYDPKFDALTLAWATASMDGDAETAAARQADKAVLKIEYQAKKEAIVNG